MDNGRDIIDVTSDMPPSANGVDVAQEPATGGSGGVCALP